MYTSDGQVVIAEIKTGSQGQVEAAQVQAHVAQQVEQAKAEMAERHTQLRQARNESNLMKQQLHQSISAASSLHQQVCACMLLSSYLCVRARRVRVHGCVCLCLRVYISVLHAGNKRAAGRDSLPKRTAEKAGGGGRGAFCFNGGGKRTSRAASNIGENS